MSKSLEFIVNIMLLSVVIVIVDGIEYVAGSEVYGLIVAGTLFSIGALLAEPILGFFKFPTNFWGLLLVGFIINLGLFMLISTNVLPGVLDIGPGAFGSGFNPIPFFRLELDNTALVAAVAAVLATLLQILVKRLAERR